MIKEQRTYLGDAVYASFDGYHIWLTTSDGIRDLARIALDPTVYTRLVEYNEDIRKKVECLFNPEQDK